jgi:uncharacterized protein YjdB
MFKKRNLIFLCLLILGVLLITSCLPKPPVTEGILKGQVIVPEGSVQTKELTGQALADATVNIIDLATGDIIATTTTDANGYYQVFVSAGGPYLLQAVKDGVKVQQITPQVEAGIEYDLGTADCSTTAVALIVQAMLDAEDYPDDLADINLADIEADPDFNDVMSTVCIIIEAGEDPTESAVIQQVVEDFLYPPAPAPTPVAVTGVTLDQATMTLTAGGATGTLVATVAPANATNKSVTWSSSAPAVATVANGVVTPLTAGTTTITVTTVDGGFTTTCAVTVNPAPVAVGDSYGGGIVAYILVNGDTGYDPSVQHGLIAATADQSTGIQWYNGSFVATGATGTAIGTGQANTTAIVTIQGAGSYAAQLCNDLTVGVYTDWFLPSKDELDKLYINKVAIGGFTISSYWSSSERDADYAWFQNFDSGNQGYDGKQNFPYRVHAVRAF